MEAGGALRFTGAEGGARLAAAVRSRNTLAALAQDHASFVASKLLQEDAYKIRGSLFSGRQRSVYITRETRVECISYDLRILTDLSVASAVDYDDIYDWYAEVDKKEILVATSAVIRRLLEEEVIGMCNVNVLVIDSCHTISEDKDLQTIMKIHSQQATPNEPRILALTYPLFSQDGKSKDIKKITSITNTNSDNSDRPHVPEEESSIDDDDSNMEPSENAEDKADSRDDDLSESLDILRIDDIITENDTTKVILVTDSAIYSNKVKIIELDDATTDKMNEIESSKSKILDKISDSLDNHHLQKNEDPLVVNVSDIESNLVNNENTMEGSENLTNVRFTAETPLLNDKISTEHVNDLKPQVPEYAKPVNDQIKTLPPFANEQSLHDVTIARNIEDIKNRDLDLTSVTKIIPNIDTHETGESTILNENADIDHIIVEKPSPSKVKLNENEINVSIGETSSLNEIKLEKNEENRTIVDVEDAEVIDTPNELNAKCDDDFNLYEKLEWKIEELERKLCCTADLAEDIDGIKRLSASVNKPRELIVEYAGCSNEEVLPESYAELEKYMRDTVNDVLHFLEEHRYDPTEIYGDDAFCDELKGIPDPTIDPKEVFQQFLYVLDELGPYGADKAAYCLVIKVEKLKVKIPYERHFLLLCLCTSMLLKIRCAAEHVFQHYESDWEKLQKFCTPKVHRLVDILTHFKPSGDFKSPRNSPNHRYGGKRNESVINANNGCDLSDIRENASQNIGKDDINQASVNKENFVESAVNEIVPVNSPTVTNTVGTGQMLKDLDKCDFLTLSNKIADKVHTYEANLSEIHDITIVPSAKFNEITSDDVTEGQIIRNNDPVPLTKQEESRQTNKQVPSTMQTLTKVNENKNADERIQVQSNPGPRGALAGIQGPPRRNAPRTRGRGRQSRYNHAARALQMQQNPDALCGVVFMREPLMAKILFMIVVELSRSHPSLGFLCAQYSAMERAADPVTEPREYEQQRRKQEEVLKKFRMHECNLLLATSALKEGIDLPRCNLVLRWDTPTSYRSFGLCRSRARAPRSACVLLADRTGARSATLLHHLATYKELDQMLSRKCGCGVRDEPPQSEEDHADMYTKIIKPYVPLDGSTYDRCPASVAIIAGGRGNSCDNGSDVISSQREQKRHNEKHGGDINEQNGDSEHRSDTIVGYKAEYDRNSDNTGNSVRKECFSDESLNAFVPSEESDLNSDILEKTTPVVSDVNKRDGIRNSAMSFVVARNSQVDKVTSDTGRTSGVASVSGIPDKVSDVKKVRNSAADEDVSEGDLASVDLSSAVSLINRYCGKLPSDTFTRLAPQWWIEEVALPVPTTSVTSTCCATNPASCTTHASLATGGATYCEKKTTMKAYICTLRLPLNCPVKYNIVGHPMRTRVLARRMVALQACRILHRSAELDNHLMPIGKENFKAPEFEYAPAPPGDAAAAAAGSHGRLTSAELAELVRPGTTKRRQYYYKRTAWSFTDCQPAQETSDAEVDAPDQTPSGDAPSDAAGTAEEKATGTAQDSPADGSDKKCGGNMLYAIVSRLWCALPERYNTRGRRLHVPQTARQGLGILTRREIKKIPAFPVYTRSGEVRVSVERVPGADVRVSARRGRLVRRFMRFVFAEVLRVRRRGMRLSTEGTHNNYYVVPTCRVVADDGSDTINIDWDFLELIYEHTEKKSVELEKQVFWNQEGSETEADPQKCDTDTRNSDAEMNSAEDTDGPTKEAVELEKGRRRESGEKSIQSNETGSSTDENAVKVNEPALKCIKSEPERENVVNSDEQDVKCSNSTEMGTKIDESGLKADENSKTDPSGATEEDSNVKGKAAGGKKEKKIINNPLLRAGETFMFDPEKYKEAVVTPWYRNQDQPQFFLVAEICRQLSPESAFPSATHTSFRHYYSRKYGVRLTQAEQPLLDVDHTSARLNLLTPRYVNRKGVALPVSSERTRRAKRDRLDQKQILVPELCRVHPFAAPLWFATVALPCVLYRINALLIADEIRRSVAIDVGLGTADINEQTRPGFEWPALDFGWSLAEVLKADGEKVERDKKRDEEARALRAAGEVAEGCAPGAPESTEKTLNDILQEKEDAESGFEIGTWTNDMAAAVPDDYDELMEPLPPNLTFCTSASGGSNWPDNIDKPTSNRPQNSSRAFSMADSDCSFMSSDFDTDDSDLETDASDDGTDATGFYSGGTSSLGVRIEYKTPHEAEAIELTAVKKGKAAPQPDEADDFRDKMLADAYLRSGDAPDEHITKFRQSVEEHKRDILEKGLLIRENEPIPSVLPLTDKETTSITCLAKTAPKIKITESKDDKSDKDHKKTEIKDGAPVEVANDLVQNWDIEESVSKLDLNHDCDVKSPSKLFKELFPYGTIDEKELMQNGQISIDTIERSKRILLEELRRNMTEEEVKSKHFFSMVDVDIDSPSYVNEKVANVGFDGKESYVEKLNRLSAEEKETNVAPVMVESGEAKAQFDFDYQPTLEGHPGPSPSFILQALTMSNANDGINLERLETIGDSFLKFAITAYLYCAQPTVHEGKLSHMRSKQVSNLNLYRLGRGRRLGARMIASKFEPHDNWLPPCHRPPATVSGPRAHPSMQDGPYWEQTYDDAECAGCAGAGGRGGGAAGACACGRAQEPAESGGCFIPYNLITQHSIPDKSVADCVEALIGAYLIECGPRGALLFMSWLGIRVLPRHEVPLQEGPHLDMLRARDGAARPPQQAEAKTRPYTDSLDDSDSECSSLDELEPSERVLWDAEEEEAEPEDWSWEGRAVGTLRPYRNLAGQWVQPVFGELRAPPSPLLRYIDDPAGELEQMLSGYEELERTLRYRFRDRSLLLQAMTHASHHLNRLTDCYQRLEFLGDAILDYLITRHLYEDERRHSPGALTDLRSALVNNTIFATLAARHGFHKYFRHMSPGLNEVLARYVKIQEENGHSISEEHYLIQEDEMEQAEDVEVPKALGDLFESVAGAIFLDSGMSLGAVWRSYGGLMGAELEAFSAAAPKSPVRELLEAEPDTAKFGKPERLADGRRVRVCVEVFGRGTFKGIGRNYRIAKGTAARCALRHLRRGGRPA